MGAEPRWDQKTWSDIWPTGVGGARQVGAAVRRPPGLVGRKFAMLLFSGVVAKGGQIGPIFPRAKPTAFLIIRRKEE